MKRRFPVLALGVAGAAAMLLSSNGDRSEAAAVDPAAVDRYLIQLSEQTPEPTAGTAVQPKDPKVVKAAGRLDRAEPIVRGVLSVAR